MLSILRLVQLLLLAQLAQLHSQPVELWTFVDSVSSHLDNFCKAFIVENSLCLPDPFSKRGSTARLREAMEAQPELRREQPSDAQSHIMWLLLNRRDEGLQAVADATEAIADESSNSCVCIA